MDEGKEKQKHQSGAEQPASYAARQDQKGKKAGGADPGSCGGCAAGGVCGAAAVQLVRTGTAESSSAFYTRIAENYPEVTFDEEEGLLFVNNELVVMTAADADRADAEALAASYDAQIADAMEDIGVYRLRFNKNMTLSELERAQTKLKKEALVEEVHINTALDVTGDAEEGEIEKKDPVYPEDPWNGASWNMDVPRGENWGMEAIHAPAAWGLSV